MKPVKASVAVLLLSAMLLPVLSGCGGIGGKEPLTIAPHNDPEPVNVPDYEIAVTSGALADDAKVTVEEVPASDVAAYVDSTKFELVGPAVKVESAQYDGTFIGDAVQLTFRIPVNAGTDPAELSRFVVAYFDEKNGAVRYFQPDSIDARLGTMTVTLPHFSLFGPAKLTEKEQIELYLNKYSMDRAVEAAGYEKAAAELEPYLSAKVAALGLSESAGKELVYAVINDVTGGFDSENASSVVGLITAACQSVDGDDYTTYEEKAEELIVSKLNERLLMCGATKASKLFTSLDKTSKLAGYLAGGDMESASKELLGLMENAVPFGSTISKSVVYLGAKVNESVTNWKANEVEELYQIYKNGAADIWGNEVYPGDDESFLTYLNTSSGFTKAKAVNRFYKMDKVAETCKKYGWPYSDYAELPDKYKELFDQRAEDGLMTYFKTRMAQEAEAARIKEEERVCIEEMRKVGGALRAGSHCEFFGETGYEDFDMTARLERLTRVRRMISVYVDEKALAESQAADAYNYGWLLNDWVTICCENKNNHGNAVRLFCAKLREYGVLNPSYDDSFTPEELAGTYTGTVDLLRVHVSDYAFNAYLASVEDGEAAAYGIDTSMTSKAECDDAINGMFEEEGITASSSIRVDVSESGECTVTMFINSDDEASPVTASAVYRDGKLILKTDEGTTEMTVTVGADGGAVLSASKVTLALMDEDEEGNSVVMYYVDFSVANAVKN